MLWVIFAYFSWHKHVFITAAIAVPIYLQAAGWPVIRSISCSLNNIVSSTLIADDILALMLGTDSAWPPSTHKKNATVNFFLYVLGGNLLLGTCWFCHKCASSDTTRAAGGEAGVQDTTLMNLGDVQQMHMLTLKCLQRQPPCRTCWVCRNTLSCLSVSPFFSHELVRLLCAQNFTIKRYDAFFSAL